MAQPNVSPSSHSVARPRRRTLVAQLARVAVMGSLLAGAATAFAQSGPLKILVGFPPGGGTDIIARVLAEKLKDPLGMPVLVEKFRTNLARRFPAKQQQAILDLCLDQARLERTPVRDFVDLMVI